MLSDNEQEVAYAHLLDAIEDWGGILNGVYDAILPEEKPMLISMSKHLDEVLEILDGTE